MGSSIEHGAMAKHFEGLVDPRVERAKRHELLDIIVITICAVICGANNWVEVEEFGHAKLEWLSRFLRLPNGIPSTTPSGGYSAVSTRSSSAPASWTGSNRLPN